MSATDPRSLDGIAIIGMAGRFPGAHDIDAFWANLKNGVESVSAFSADELVEAGVDPALLRDPAYVKARALLDGADLFDAGFFGYTPHDAANMDPQQRVFLECAWEALEHAGYDSARYPGTIGLYAGHSLNTYLLANLCAGREWIDEFLDGRNVGSFQTFLGNDKDYLTSRVAYKLNLRGPAVTVQTACSTSLVAVCLACQSLLTQQSDIALAGGVSIGFPQKKGYLYREGGITSPDGHCRAFDARAQGTVFGSGAGVVVLKRVADALADGDQIYAVIRGSALNNDGALKFSYTAPGVDGQAEVIVTAQTLAGISPDTIGYIEAHGTGTPLGDPVELAALTQAFRIGTERRQFCALGSVKTNIGHLDAAAGVAGLIKTALALHHRQIPPSLHFEHPNPRIDFERSPFFVNTAHADWTPPPGTPRRAGVSSFGVGGTNAHVVLEEAPAAPPPASAQPAQLLLLSARSAAALEAATTNLCAHLQRHPALNLADAAYTLQVGRREFAHRRALVGRDTAEAVAALASRDARRLSSQVQTARDVAVVFLFPGQGAQAVNMGRELRETEPVFHEQLDRCLALASAELGRDLRDILFPPEGKADEAERALTQTQFTQPALFAVEYALAQLWMSWGIRPVAMIGHSLGEYVAACLAGVFSLEDAVALVVKRARLVQAQPGGAMLAVRLTAEEVKPRIAAPLSLAAVNAPNLCVVSGPADAIDALEQRLRADGITGIRLKTSHAFHSAMLEPAVAPLAAEVRQLTLGPPQLPWLSNVTGRWITAAEATSPEYWATHLRETVRFSDSVAELLKTPNQVLLEVGPGQTLAGLARQQPAAKTSAGIFPGFSAAKDEVVSVLSTLGKLWLAGGSPDWAGFHAQERRRRVPLPSYPFERKRHFVEPPARTVGPALVAGPSLDERDDRSGLPASGGPTGNSSLVVSPRERITAALISLFRELSGVELRDTDCATPLIELGFDSLFLTQVRQSFQSRFGVNITYRQLADSLNTIDALAAHLAEHAATETNSVANCRAAACRQAEPRSPSGPATSAGPTVAQPLGPYRPLAKSSASPLTTRQRTWLAEFTARYNRRTANSKRIAAENRRGVADPRSLANYRPLWKELVYQIVADSSAGAHLRDVDGNDYLDVTMGFGANLFGHSPAFVTDAVAEQLRKGVHLGPQSSLTGEVAALIREFTGLERVTFCNTGSEAVLAALRVARTVTKRSKIVYFSGDYHGLFDEVLMRPQQGDGALRSVPVAPGIPLHAGADAIVLDYGAPEALETIRQLGAELAAVLVEPVQSRNPELQPREFLHELRRITRDTGTVLIFDEVITGFRVHPGGAQAWFDVRADLATYGKTIGGGLPFGVLAGAARCMDALDGGAWNFGDDSGPEADLTFFAGTFVRHPLALAAARASLQHLKERGPELQASLNRRTAKLAATLNAFFESEALPLRIHHFGSLFRFHFPPELPHATLLVYQLLERGIYFRDAHQNCFLSTAHTDADVARFIAAVKIGVAELQAADFLPRRELPAPPPPFPLTDAQQEIWLACQWSPDLSRAYNQSLTLDLRGPLDFAALSAAWNELLGRHEALRLTIAPDGETQQVAPPRATELPLADWSTLPETERVANAAAIATDEATQAFDLIRGPLVRARVCRLAAAHHLFVFTAHHLVCDGWSVDVLFDELGKVYSAKRTGAPVALGRATPFCEFARGEASRESRAEFAAAGRYWLGEFASLPPALELPEDHPRSGQTGQRGGTERLALSAALVAELNRVAARHRVSFFTLVLAAYQLLLRRLSSQEECVVGIVTSGQAKTDGGRSLVGHGVNLLPIRNRSARDASFAQWLVDADRLLLDAREHDSFSYGRLLQKLKLRRDGGRPPLMSALLNLDPAAADALKFDGLEVTLEPNAKSYANFDVFLNLRGRAGGLVADLEYNRELFEPTTIRRWLGHFETLLGGIVADPARRVCELPLLSAAERAQLLVQWNDTRRDYPRDATVPELFEEQVARRPAAVAVEFGGARITYRELNRRANQLAYRLSVLGVRPDTPVAVCLERSVELIVALLGILKAGGAYAALDPEYPRERLAFLLDDLGVRVVLTQGALRAALPEVAGVQMICVDELPDEGRDANPPPTTRAEHLAYISYTSGSTGQPKGVCILHRGVVRLVRGTDYARFGPDETFLQLAPVGFDASTFEIWGALLNGARLAVYPPGTPSLAELGAFVAERGVTTVWLTAGLFHALADGSLESWRGVRQLLAGGDTLSPTHVQKVLQALPLCRLINGYGPTENTTFTCCQPIASVEGAIPIGRPIPNTEVYLLDEAQQPAPIGVPGELWVGGDGLARGYLNRPELTAEKFAAHPFKRGERLYRTGDRARWRPDGSIDFLGRSDRQVKVRGFRVEPGEIEAQLHRHPNVRACVVTADTNVSGDQRLIAHIVPAGAAPPPAELRAFLQQRVPAHLVPGTFVFVPELPLTANGKIDYRALPGPESVERAPRRGSVAPATAAEQALARIWGEVLGATEITALDNFFALGGHSLLAMRVAARVRSAFQVNLSMKQIFDAATLADLATLLEDLLHERIAALSDDEAERAIAPENATNAR